MTEHSRVLLVFPPVVTTNFGRYYPSLAALAAYLERESIPADQLDLNNDLLEFCVSPERLEAIIAAGDSLLERGGDEEPEVDSRMKQVLAARAAQGRSAFYDVQGKLLPAGHALAPTEILGALSHDYYLDVPLEQICAETFWRLSQVQALQAFIRGHRRLHDRLAAALVLGISVPMGPQLAPGLVLAREAAERGVPVVLGGPTVTLLRRADLARLLQAHPWVTALIPYQGEEPLMRLIGEMVDQGRRDDWHEVPGVLSLDRASDLAGTAAAAGSRRLSALPFGSYDRCQLGRLSDPEVAIRQAEGCYWGRCAYCDYVELYPKTGRTHYRPQGIGVLVDEIEHHVKTYGVRRFVLITEAVPPRVARTMSEEIVARGLEVQWSSFAMVDPGFDRETLSAMADGGCTHLVVGVETMADRVLQLVRKRATRELTERFFTDCRAAGIPLIINLIPNLPSTTRADALESLACIERHLDCFLDISIFPFEATVSSDIGRDPARFGLTVLPIADDDMSGQAEFAANHLAITDPAMSPEELRDVLGRHYDLAARVCSGPARQSAVSAYLADAGCWHLDREHLDVYLPRSADRGPITFNWRTGVVSQYPSAWRPILGAFDTPSGLDGAGVVQAVAAAMDLRGVEAEAVAFFVLSHLESRGMLVAAGQARTKPLAATG
jgi:hypothetical protein